jgi:DNA-binding response OmpR family regulator
MAFRCLVVDDDARFLESAKLLLHREGVEVDTASSGAQAIRQIGVLRPDVVLLDIHLGEESGFAVAHELHAAWPTAGSPEGGARIILISTNSERDYGRLIETSPVLGFIAKSSLSAHAIREVLRGRR